MGDAIHNPSPPGATDDPPGWQLPRCPECGYDLQTLPAIGVCPECGNAYDRSEVILVGCARGGRAGVHNAAPRKIGWYLFWTACGLGWNWLVLHHDAFSFAIYSTFALFPVLVALVVRFFASRDYAVRAQFDDEGFHWRDSLDDYSVYAGLSLIGSVTDFILLVGIPLLLFGLSIYAIYQSGLTAGTAGAVALCTVLAFWFFTCIRRRLEARAAEKRRPARWTFSLPWSSICEVTVRREEAVFVLAVRETTGIFGVAYELEFPFTETQARQLEEIARSRIPPPVDASISHVWTHTEDPEDPEDPENGPVI